jgi:iron complex transport system substrate-binding protein
VRRLPKVTRCDLHDAKLSSSEIDRWVSETLQASGTLYRLDEPLLRQLEPDLILTQRLCDVCAVEFDSVAALAASLPKPPRVVNLEPSMLRDIFENLRTVAEQLAVRDCGERIVRELESRVECVRRRVASLEQRPRCVVMEWIDPPFCSGHWGPELVRIAGGIEPLGNETKNSTRVLWDRIVDADPEVLVLACCGYDPNRTLQDVPILRQQPGWQQLTAVRQGRVYVIDGNAYFNRPGPRIVDTLEILAEILHPEAFAGIFPDRGVQRLVESHGKRS